MRFRIAVIVTKTMMEVISKIPSSIKPTKTKTKKAKLKKITHNKNNDTGTRTEWMKVNGSGFVGFPIQTIKPTKQSGTLWKSTESKGNSCVYLGDCEDTRPGCCQEPYFTEYAILIYSLGWGGMSDDCNI